MKSSFFILGGLCALLITTLSSCDSTPSTHSEVLIFIDQTDSILRSSINAEEITAFIEHQTKTDLSAFTDNSINVTVYALSQFQIIPQKIIQLPKSEGIMGVDKLRTEEQIRFRKRIIQTINQSKINIKMKPKSKLIWPICNRLNQLSAKKADKKIVLLFSDLFENNKQISFYKASPEKIDKHIQSQTAQCNDWSDIELYCIYYPNTIQEDERFSIVQNSWAKAITSKNATFTHIPNL